MSTKTSIKRIALVAVSALGFGLLSVIPANAAAITASSLTAGAGTPARAFADYYQSVTFTKSAGASIVATDALNLSVTTLAKPTGSAVGATILPTFVEFSSTQTYAGGVFTINAGNSRIGLKTASLYLTFEPDMAGSYQFLAYSPAVANAAYTSGDTSALITVTVAAGAPASATITSVGGSSVAGTTYGGALLSIVLKDASGNVTVPNKFETVSLAAVSSAATPNTIKLDKTPADGATNDTVSPMVLTEDDFFGGEADVNAYITNAPTTADVVSFTASISGATVGTLGSANVSYAAPSSTLNATVGAMSIDFASTKTSTTAGYGALAATTAVDPSLTSHAWSLKIAGAAAAAGTTSRTFAVNVTDTTGEITGYIGYTWTIPVSLAAEKQQADFSIAGSWLSNALAASYTLTPMVTNGANGAVTGLGVQPLTNTAYTASITTPAASVRSAFGSANTFTATVKNAYGVAQPNVIVNVAQTGRNAKVTTTNIVTNSSGQVSYTVTDASTSTSNLVDTITFLPTGGSANNSADALVTYQSALTIGTVTVTGGSTADTAAYPAVGSSTYLINTGTSGAAGSTVTFTATVKDANGVLLSGIPVTWTVDKATSGITKSTTADASTCYTNGAGTCTTTVYSWEAPSKVTVTATAGGKSGTGYANFVNAATDARVVSATAASNVVTAKVVDRYGNPVAGVNLTASTTAGYFGTGASTSLGTTGADGTVKFILLGANSATVTVTGSAATYGQLDDAAGKIGTTAVTAAVAGTSTGVGSSLAPAGVDTASVAVTVTPDTAAVDAANAASDAAAEAIDAANAATDAANLAAEAADAATVAAEEARDAADAATAAVEELATQVATLMAALKAQITTLANTVAKIAKKVKA